MVLGTASHVGKSLMTAAFCRIFARRGYSVAPFKAQNMSLNSAATVDGFEIGRAQALQAEAAYQVATREMNPILLKPDSDQGCQIVAGGRPWGHLSACQYHQDRVEELFPLVIESYQKLASAHDLIILEGAGSPAEINLKDHDIVNMRMAAAADAACLLVGDIDRGGVFASIFGTLELLAIDERQRIQGILINKFRGDLELLKPGVQAIEQKTGKTCVGVVPYIANLDLDQEDSVSLESLSNTSGNGWQATNNPARQLRIAVISLPYFSNFTDFDALLAEPSVSLLFVKDPRQLQHADLIVLPGTKNTIYDFTWLRASGIAGQICEHAQSGLVIGICGGMQMLGLSISDPHHMESGGQVRGLGLLPIRTVLKQEKTTVPVTAHLKQPALLGLPFTIPATTGYEIHLGETTYEPEARPLFHLVRSNQAPGIDDGAESSSGRCFGTYVHGLFDSDEFRHALLANARTACKLAPARELVFRRRARDAALNRLADTVEQAVNLKQILSWLGLPLRAEAACELQ
jgi:adenosylcobyric acid synthase